MKRTTLMVLGTMLALCAGTLADPASGNSAQKVPVLYQQGVNALKDGDTKTAAALFREVLRLQPSHGNARYQLLNLSRRQPGLAGKVRERKLSQIRIPKVNFEGASFEDALDTLDALITKETKGEFAPNFIIQDPHGQLEGREITMQLGAVPANVVFDYVLKMVNAKARFDEHAIVIQPIGRVRTPAPPPVKPGGPSKRPDDPFAD